MKVFTEEFKKYIVSVVSAYTDTEQVTDSITYNEEYNEEIESMVKNINKTRPLKKLERLEYKIRINNYQYFIDEETFYYYDTEKDEYSYNWYYYDHDGRLTGSEVFTNPKDLFKGEDMEIARGEAEEFMKLVKADIEETKPFRR